MDLAERALCFMFGFVALPYEIVAVMQMAEHGDVAPLEQAEREDFFHGQIMRKLRVEILELTVR